MSPNLALLAGLVFIGLAFLWEFRRSPAWSPALFWVLLWCLIAASRSVGIWLYLWGFEGLGSSDPTEGSAVERVFYGSLAAIGGIVLLRRRIDWRVFANENRWVLFLFLYMVLSVGWSDYSLVSFKRFVKSFGTAVMAMVVLTDANPIQAILAVLRRCAYVHIPLSIITIKYFRHIGVMWNEFSGDASWVGIASSKNTLGQIASVSALVFICEWLRNRGNTKNRMIPGLYVLMSLYLLKGSDGAVSMTSLSVLALCLCVFWRLQSLRTEPLRAKHFFQLTSTAILGLLVLLLTHSVWGFSENSLMGVVIRLLGRDMTLTGRTEIWTDVFAVASRSPLIGVGYGGFWIGRLANIPWSEGLSWVLGQAHNGYVDTYLQLGWLGVCLLMLVIFSAIPRIAQSFAVNFEYGQVRMTFFLVILFVNITESTFLRGEHFLWLLFLFTAISVPYGRGSGRCFEPIRTSIIDH